MTITVESIQTQAFSGGPTLQWTFYPSYTYDEGDLLLITAVAEGSSTLTITTPRSGLTWTSAGSQLVDRTPLGDLCTIYAWYTIAPSDSGISTNIRVTSSDAVSWKKFMIHRLSSTLGFGGEAVTAVFGKDVVPSYPVPGFPPTYDIDGLTLSTFDDALLRVAACNDNGDEGTFDTTQAFSGHTRLAIQTGDEVGMISLRKDSVAAGAVSTLTLDTISVAGGEVDGIGFANFKLREGAGGGSKNMTLLGVG